MCLYAVAICSCLVCLSVCLSECVHKRSHNHSVIPSVPYIQPGHRPTQSLPVKRGTSCNYWPCKHQDLSNLFLSGSTLTQNYWGLQFGVLENNMGGGTIPALPYPSPIPAHPHLQRGREGRGKERRREEEREERRREGIGKGGEGKSKGERGGEGRGENGREGQAQLLCSHLPMVLSMPKA